MKIPAARKRKLFSIYPNQETAMRHLIRLMAAAMAVFIVTFVVVPTAYADARSDCIATCKGLDKAEWPACFAKCPPKGVTPPPPPVTTQKPPPPPPPVTTQKPPPPPPPGECPENMEKDANGVCVCRCGFDKVGEGDQAKCLATCGTGVCRNPDTHKCEKCEGDKEECEPTDCEDSCPAATAMLNKISDQEGTNFWLLIVIILGVATLLGWRIKDALDKKSEDDEEGEPEPDGSEPAKASDGKAADGSRSESVEVKVKPKKDKEEKGDPPVVKPKPKDL